MFCCNFSRKFQCAYSMEIYISDNSSLGFCIKMSPENCLPTQAEFLQSPALLEERNHDGFGGHPNNKQITMSRINDIPSM